MRLHAKGQSPEERIQIARVDIFINSDHHFSGGRMIAHHAVQRLPNVRLIDFLHPDDANLTHCDAVKGDLDDSWNVALIAKKPQIVSLSGDLAHHARLTGRHLADDRG